MDITCWTLLLSDNICTVIFTSIFASLARTVVAAHGKQRCPGLIISPIIRAIIVTLAITFNILASVSWGNVKKYNGFE